MGLSEPPPTRIIHDTPPGWDGSHPDRELEPYIKLLKGWLATTRTQKTQQGMTILHYSSGDLKVIINELEVDVLCADDSGEVVLKHIQSQYMEYLEKKLPQKIEQCFFDRDLARKKGESMLQYCTRRNTLFKQLAKEGWEIPELPKGYILLRDANLPDKARDLIEMWSGGIYNYTEMQQYLKRLERPMPGSGGMRLTGLTAFLDLETEEEEESQTFMMHGSDSDMQTMVFMQESLFVLPE